MARGLEIRGSVAVITGASSGIGAATARELARQGASVVLAARRAERIHALAEEIVRQGGRALAVPTDVTERADVDRLVERTIEAYGRIDVLVNNAGVGGGSSIDARDKMMQQIVAVNLLAPARCVQAALPHMRRQGRGVIVNIGSVAGEIGVSALYSGTKFGVRGLSDALRRELRRDHIAVALVEPGFIRTPMTTGMRVPLPDPEVVARTVAGAIRHPRRKVIVPWYYVPPALMAKVLPGCVDWLVGSSLFQRLYHGRIRTL
jgi:NAD(P)-dependent dehydrogenase (short-subunit alcohol dehydrogenase family)